MSIQSRKNNNKTKNKNNKNKRTRKRPLQRGGYIRILTKDISGVQNSIQTTIYKYNKFIKKKLTETEYKKINLEFIQVDDDLFFMEQEEQQGLYNIIKKNTTPDGSLRKQVLKDDIKGQFETSISTFLRKTVEYIGQEQVWNPKNFDNSGQPSYYTLFKFNTTKADTKVEVKNDKAVEKEVYDKLSKMMTEITSKITKDMSSAIHHIKLEYIDIKLDMSTMNLETKEGYIHIYGFSRGHHVKEFPSRRIKFAPSKNTDPASDKGDGSIFLALTVKHCNDIFQNIPYWKGSLSKWWTLQGVCSIQKACMVTVRSSPLQEINNDFFLEWSNKIINTFNVTTLSKNKTSKAEDAKIEKVEADETGGAKAYATIMNIVKEALEDIDNDNTEKTIEAFYQTIQDDPDMFLTDEQPWKAIKLSERKLALKYFSEQKNKLLHEATPILKIIPKTDTDTDTDKGIKTYLNSKEYNESDFKKLAVQFITQNPDITNEAIDILTFP